MVEVLSRYVVADPTICDGKLAFRRTRICVADVLSRVASGVAWEAIVEETDGAVSTRAIADALRLALEALVDHVEQPLYEAGRRDPGKVSELGRYVVANPGICHGRLTFRGTRVFVVAVLEDVADGLSYYTIVRRRHGLPEDAIAEAVRVACDALLEHWEDLLKLPVR